MVNQYFDHAATCSISLNRGPKPPFKLREIWAIRIRLQLEGDTRDTVQSWIDQAALGPGECLFPSRLHASAHLSTRQYSRIVKDWVASIGLYPAEYGTHSLRRTKATLIYRKTKNLRAVQILLGHAKRESTVRYLGVGVDDVLEISQKTEI